MCFDAGYRDVSSLTALIQSAAVVVLPYDSTDQVTSGVLVDAIASGRPVVATAFPHAVELLGSGAGIVVDHDDPDALASALRRVLTQPRLAGVDGGRGPPIGARDGVAGRGERVSGVWRTGSSLSGRRWYDRYHAGSGIRPSAATDRPSRHLRARRFAEPRPEHGYCTDDVARVLVVATREPDARADAERSRRCGVAVPGRGAGSHRRLPQPDGQHWPLGR